jgi:hypothetical protein
MSNPAQNANRQRPASPVAGHWTRFADSSAGVPARSDAAIKVGYVEHASQTMRAYLAHCANEREKRSSRRTDNLRTLMRARQLFAGAMIGTAIWLAVFLIIA